LSGIRQKTARLAENWRSIPHVFQAVEADLTAVGCAPRHRQPSAPRMAPASPICPFIARATCLALAAFLINARFDGTALFPSATSTRHAVDLNHQASSCRW
jgi:hypothetical protein